MYELGWFLGAFSLTWILMFLIRKKLIQKLGNVRGVIAAGLASTLIAFVLTTLTGAELAKQLMYPFCSLIIVSAWLWKSASSQSN